MKFKSVFKSVNVFKCILENTWENSKRKFFSHILKQWLFFIRNKNLENIYITNCFLRNCTDYMNYIHVITCTITFSFKEFIKNLQWFCELKSFIAYHGVGLKVIEYTPKLVLRLQLCSKMWKQVFILFHDKKKYTMCLLSMKICVHITVISWTLN